MRGRGYLVPVPLYSRVRPDPSWPVRMQLNCLSWSRWNRAKADATLKLSTPGAERCFKSHSLPRLPWRLAQLESGTRTQGQLLLVWLGLGKWRVKRGAAVTRAWCLSAGRLQ